MQFLLKVEQFVLFALEHLGDRNSSPSGNDFGDVIAIDLFLDERFITLHAAQLFLEFGILVLLLLDERIADFGHTSVVSVAFSAFSLKVELLNVDFVLLDVVDEFFFALPLGIVVTLAVF